MGEIMRKLDKILLNTYETLLLLESERKEREVSNGKLTNIVGRNAEAEKTA